jgi:hypothetical protein
MAGGAIGRNEIFGSRHLELLSVVAASGHAAEREN